MPSKQDWPKGSVDTRAETWKKKPKQSPMVHRHLLIRIFQSLTGILLGVGLVFAFLRFQTGRTQEDPESYFLPDPLPAPVFHLMSHEGRMVTSENLPGQLLAVFFGYTFCPDVCPLTLSHLSQAFEIMGEDGGRVQVVLITVDPERDTPDRLRDYLNAFHGSFLGLTGSEEEIRQVADGFGVFFARSGEGDDYTVDHTARTFVVDGSGQIRLTFPVTATPQEMARDLSVLLEDMS